MTTTSRRSRVGLGFAHLLSTLIVCGLALLASTPRSSEDVFNAGSFEWNLSVDTSSGPQWVAGAIEADPPDSDDDNDDDDSPDSSDSVVLAAPRAVISNVRTHRPFDLPFTPASTPVARDAHSLRAPPR